MILQIIMDLPDDPLSVPICRRALRTILRELAVDEMRAYEIELALGEATANVIRHAYECSGNRYRVELGFFPDRLRLVVNDFGRGFDRASVPSPEEDAIGGRGLMLIEQIADATHVEALESGGTRVTAEFNLTDKKGGALERVGAYHAPGPACAVGSRLPAHSSG
jgi:serine/threonine-protein kinase RsbW